LLLEVPAIEVGDRAGTKTSVGEDEFAVHSVSLSGPCRGPGQETAPDSVVAEV
jgi:hypothetical protein